ncbi:DUF4349 domain-containing protein [Aneurinibacillus aneurinilyticus]|uniref:DUF4349 domain-containing protein n=1 Tax=Aneurinibacillus aneurinilyticus ATCC 12856 TaxID=649747 RepID=U1Y8T2_ANEAE|nr:DUF4349 domain-containing protein [Aneurinibacillus aneurinilyticus]ERI08572.1 hypothetical protein HMPREF0083_03300 [Aneurinibacillus aneurinilyticus ATCC 12856]MED0706099.1 DUF4349 domain-containing protein [Aneurinibacillus aneurinilyticus]MED0723258.1 DUF4349 domain-containing protein [Aneurinibacillus aneurinilyticus]MED0732673.1 DUF4349 domain-containing protein [Aneurinibacillus aneurinilyticus]MED0739810.1 DUF4349 domain-containing protein [Aneurinibacillus aneurinilyticus]
MTNRSRYNIWIILGWISILLIAGCGASNQNPDSSMADTSQSQITEIADSKNPNTAPSEKKSAGMAAMMVYQAELSLNVKDLATSQKSLTQLVEKMNGYIVEANSYNQGEENSLLNGNFRIRIPNAKFNAFLEETEKLALKVANRTIQGRDVTEEYIDLEARLASKQVLEKQLLGLMKNAQKTSDLLQIAQDVNKVQTEIEQLKGKMKYLKNQSDFATVTIHMTENKAVLPSLSDNPVSTWDKTKQQFMNSIKFMVDSASVLFVVIVGTSPLLLFIGAIIAGIMYWKKRKGKKDESV